MRIALPQSLARLQLAIDSCARQIERAHDDDLVLELAGVQHALGELEDRIASLEDPNGERYDDGRALPRATDFKRLAAGAERGSPAAQRGIAPGEPARALGGSDGRDREDGLFPNAFRRPPQPLPPLGESVRIETGGPNGSRRES
jgi:hypothetical protein